MRRRPQAAPGPASQRARALRYRAILSAREHFTGPPSYLQLVLGGECPTGSPSRPPAPAADPPGGREAPDEQALHPEARPDPGARDPDVTRQAGSASSATLIRSHGRDLALVHRDTGPGECRPGEHGDDPDTLRQMYSSGSVVRTSTLPGSTPASSVASRSAAAAGPESVASMAPPGNAGWPGCCRIPWLRWMNSRSGPAGPSAKRIRTAAGRPPDDGGCRGGSTSMRAADPASSMSQRGGGGAPGASAGRAAATGRGLG